MKTQLVVAVIAAGVLGVLAPLFTEVQAQAPPAWEGPPLQAPPEGWKKMPGGRGPRGAWGSAPEAAPLPKDEAEKRILEVAEQARGFQNVPQEDGRLIRLLTEAIGAKHALEIGTSTGYSGLWFAAALRTTGGKLTTLEIDAGRAATARANFKKAGIDNIVSIIEGDAHETVKKLSGPFDIVFIDADKEGYADYLQKVLPLVRPGGLILAHNIRSRNDNPEYVDAVTKNPALETIGVNGQMLVTLNKR